LDFVGAAAQLLLVSCKKNYLGWRKVALRGAIRSSYYLFNLAL